MHLSRNLLFQLTLLLILPAVFPSSAWAGLKFMQTIAVGKGPDGVTIGDFNGDTIPDLATTTQGTVSVVVFLGNGDGTFQLGASYPVGALPFSVTTADLNRDGKLDLITANGANTSEHGNISILMGNGDGTFQPAVNLDAGDQPSSIAVSDLNGDGKPDLAVADIAGTSRGNGVSVLLGNGDGSFGPAAFYESGGAAISVVTGDFNHDGKPDLATANYLGASVSVRLGNGDGTFQRATQYHVGSSKLRPNQLAVIDLNSDGVDDLVVAVFDAYGRKGRVAFLRSRGDGTFFPPVTYFFPRNVYSVAAGDLDNDGKTDFVVGNSLGVTPAFNLGEGKFSKQGVVGSRGWPLSVALADLTGSGSLDVVEADYRHGTITILLNTGGR